MVDIVKIDVGSVITKGEESYEIVDFLGGGSSGKVFRAKPRSPNEFDPEIAVKVPSAAWLNGTNGRQMFHREARILGNIEHPNVVKIIDLWAWEDGSMALLQELVDGGVNLRAFIRGATDEQRVCVFLQTLYGLRAIHSNEGAIHRDIAPTNILVDKSGTVKIVDFGLAREIERRSQGWTRAGEPIGTPGCVAPEQEDDAANCDHRADLYGLGRAFASSLQDRRPVHIDIWAIAEPWGPLLRRLAAHEAAERFQTADEAVNAAVRAFGLAGLAPADLLRHQVEFAFGLREPPEGWSLLASAWLASRADFTTRCIAAAAKVRDAIAEPWFDVASMFDRLEASSGLAALAPGGGAGYSAADPAGEVLRAVYPNLDPPQKVRCFRRLVRIAVDKHRYSVMQDVRAVFRGEKDPSMRDTLSFVLDEEDPEEIIEGRGVIPGR